MKHFVVLICCILTLSSMGQDKLPYYEITENYEEYTAGTVTARMLDGLGFRFYWATEGITEKELSYKASEEGRTYLETVRHILGLSRIVVNSALKQPNDNAIQYPELSYDEMRAEILNNVKTASDILKAETDLNEFNIVFKSEKGDRVIPFWNNINGPIEDAVWHCGQLVVLRRAAGNPMLSKPSFFNGKVRN
ncbi:MAG: hypothetical protein BM563_05125 [Bacteroidetes bacterium MedPE-SWsnd-G1]|nr:MAG: hypothetical protein BM563_05125 [Bacteroidetes bacterium MedPE-SWsnd-G1]